MNRDPQQKNLYCIHGTFPDHCGACNGAYMDRLEAELEALKKAVKKVSDYNGRLEAELEALKKLLRQCSDVVCDGYNCHDKCMCSLIGKALLGDK